MTKLVRHLAPIVIAVVIGPLIPAILIWLPVLAESLFDGGTSTVGDAFGGLIFDVVFAYVVGGPIALLAGILVSIWMIWREPGLVVAIGAAAIATLGFMMVAATGFLGEVEEFNGNNNLWIVLVLAVISAAGCWFLVWLLARSRLRARWEPAR